MKEQIEYSEFLEVEKKLEIKTGKVTAVEDVPKSSKLIKLTVDFGDRFNEDVRTVVTNIKPVLGEDYREQLLFNSFLFITNLKPVVMMGVESTAMILPGELPGHLVKVSTHSVNIL